MTASEILFLAAALAMDAFSVSVSSGMDKNCTLKNMFVMAFAFGLFQFIMPIIGNGTALLFSEYTEKYSALISAAILAFIGIRMVWDAVKDDGALPVNPFSIPSVITLAIATSIDALAAGISIGAAGVDGANAALFSAVLVPSAVIGIVAMLFSFAGLCLGKFTRRFIRFPAGILGGVILIILALKSLISFIL